jgi:hypothetical protein
MSTSKTLTPNQAITKLMNESNRSNATFLQNQIGEGILYPNTVNTAAPAIQRIAGSRSRRGLTPLGSGADIGKPFTTSPRLSHFKPDPEFNPEYRADELTDSSFKLTKEISIGTFTGSENSPVEFGSSSQDRMVIAMNLYLQAEILKAARSRKEFNRYRIAVEEGIYNYEEVETPTEGDLADLSSKGRAIAYNVQSFTGSYSNLKVFSLAEYLLDYPFYDKLILDYHTYVSDTPRCRLFVVIPDMSRGYRGVTFARETETRFNGRVQSGSLVLLNSDRSDRQNFV